MTKNELIYNNNIFIIDYLYENIFKVKDTFENIYYILLIKDKFIKFSIISLYIVNKYKWFIGKNGYAITKINEKLFYMHSLILKNNFKDKTIDHINKNRLDNRIENLRLINIIEQNLNREFKKRYVTLELPKHIYYCNEKNRDFFKIEKNNKITTSSKSNKISLINKYIEILNKLKIDENEKKLPKYIRLKKKDNLKYCLIYDRKIENERQTMSITFIDNVQYYLTILKSRIQEKYNFII